MRRKDRETKDRVAIEKIIRDSIVCRVAMSKDSIPYVVPMCFGYENNTIYLHGAVKGKKIDILKSNPNVCVEFDIKSEVMESDKACDFDMKYESVIACGKAVFLEDLNEKRAAFNTITKQYSTKTFNIPDIALRHIAAIKIDITDITGKMSGYKQ